MWQGYEIIGEYWVKTNETIGLGTFGKVYRCLKYNQINVELFNGCSDKEENQKKQLDQEIKILQKLKNEDCENLVKMIDFLDQPQQLCIVMELCEYDLSKELKTLKNSNTWLSRSEMLDMIRQILKGAFVLINNHLIHRDIKPQNILVKIINKGQQNQRKIYKIADFGFAKYLEDVYDKANLTRVGTVSYCAPEIFKGINFSCKCDIYSYGILFHQIVYNLNFPNQYNENDQIHLFINSIQENPYKCPPLQGEYGDIIINLIERMLIYDQDQRLSFEEIQSHQIMKISHHNPKDSIYLPIERGISEQEQQNILQQNEDEKFKRLNLLIKIFHRKYLVCQNFVNFMKQKTIPCNFEFLILQQFIELVGFNQLNYGFAMINKIVNDLEPSILQDNEIPELIELLDQYMIKSQKNQAYHQLHKQIINEYHEIKKKFKEDLNALIMVQVQQNWTQNQKEFQLLYQTRTRKIPNEKCLQIIQELTKKQIINNWLNSRDKVIKESLQTIKTIDTDFKIENYKNINPDQIFKI